jgi:hypothetical protein
MIGEKTSMHLCITKAGFIEQIRLHGGRRVLNDWKGESDDDLIAQIEAMPYDTIVMGECDHQAEGHCLGHKFIDCEPCGGTGKVECLACDGKGRIYLPLEST